jgi:hypothetical protein
MKPLVTIIIITLATAFAAISQEKVGIGTTFFYVGLTFEAFAELPFWDFAAFRLGSGLFAGGDYAGFLGNCGGTLSFGDTFCPYLGIEGVAGMFIRPQNAWLAAWDWLVGFSFRFSENFGIYAQARFLKHLATETWGISLPGVGFPLIGLGALVRF